MRFSLIIFTVLLAFFAVSPIASKQTKRQVFKPAKGQESECFKFICNNTSIYPENYIQKMLSKHKKTYNKIFGTVIEPIEPIILPFLRSRPAAAEENFCASKRVTVFPKIAYDLNYKQVFIVNVKGHEQSVSFETCVSEDNKCFGDVLLSYTTKCKQLYNIVRLLYITEKGKLEYGKFSVPSACVCTYKKAMF